MLDDSQNTGADGFQQTKDFLKTMLEWFNVDSAGTNIAVMTYSNTARIQFNFPVTGSNFPPQNLEDMQQRIDNIPYSGGSSSRLDKALEIAAAQVFPEGLVRRKNSKKVFFYFF